MPRDGSGNYSLPAGNPVVSGTIIESDWANTTMPDLGNEITNSLSRQGEGGMLAPLRHANGTALVPSITFTNDIQSGMYLANPSEVVMSIAGVNSMRWTTSGVQIWNGSSWDTVGEGFLPTDGSGYMSGTLKIGDDVSDVGLAFLGDSSSWSFKPDGETLKLTLADSNGDPTADTFMVAHTGAYKWLEFYSQNVGVLGVVDTGLEVTGRVSVSDTLVLDDYTLLTRTYTNINYLRIDGGNYMQSILRVDNTIGGDQARIAHARIRRFTNECSFTYSSDGTGATEGTLGAELYLNSGTARLQSDQAGTSQIQLAGNVDISGNQVQLIDDGQNCARTYPPVSGGFQVNNLFTGAGYERVLTQSDLAPRPVVVDELNSDTLTNYDIVAADLGKSLLVVGGDTMNVTLPNTGVGVGFYCTITNYSVASVQILGAVGTTVNVPAGGGTNFIEQYGYVTVQKIQEVGGNSVWQIYGLTEAP